MVYSNKLVAVLKVDGRILRDDKEVYSLPFGSEYDILLKNLSMNRCLVGVQIDGVDVLSGNKIILDASSTHVLSGFLDSRTNRVTNRFKFIQKTEKIADYRGDRIDDGFINITFQFEKPVNYSYITYIPPVQFRSTDVYGSFSTSSCIAKGNRGSQGPVSIPGSRGPMGVTGCAGESVFSAAASCDTNYIQQDEGITVKGSQVNHQYITSSVNNLDPEKHNIVLRLKGYMNTSQPVISPVYTNTKLLCSTCGRNCKSHIKFCPDCGTSLI